MSSSSRYVSSQDSRRLACKDQLPRGKTLKLLDLPHTPVYICTYGHSSTCAAQASRFLDITSLLQFGLLLFQQVFYTQNAILLLSSWRTTSLLNLLFSTLTMSCIFLVFCSPSSTSVFTHFIKASRDLPLSVTARYLSISILSSLQLGPHDPHLNPALVPFEYQACSSDRIPTFSLSTSITSTHKTFLALLPKHKTFF